MKNQSKFDENRPFITECSENCMIGIYHDTKCFTFERNIEVSSQKLSKNKQNNSSEIRKPAINLLRPDLANATEILKAIPNRGNNNHDLLYTKWFEIMCYAKYAKIKFYDVLKWSGHDPETKIKWDSIPPCSGNKNTRVAVNTKRLQRIYYNICGYTPMNALSEIRDIDVPRYKSMGIHIKEIFRNKKIL